MSAWEVFVDGSFSRLFALWRSTSQSMRRKHLRRARKYVITGDADASKAEEREAVLKALFSSPEMLAVVITMVIAAGSFVLCLLQLPFLLNEPKEGEASSCVIGALRVLLSSDDSALRFILTSIGLLTVYAFMMSAVTCMEVARIAAAKNPLIARTCHLDTLYYYELEDGDTEWYTIVNRMVPRLVRMVFRFLESPLVLLADAVLSAFYLSGSSGLQLLFAMIALLMTLYVGWEHCWSGIACESSPGEASSGGGLLPSRAWRARRLLADLQGLRLGYTFLVLLVATLWHVFALNHVLVAAAVALDPSIGPHLFNVLSAYALFQVFWRFAAQAPLKGIKDLLALEEKLRCNHQFDVRSAVYEHHSFSAWCKRLAWMKAYSFAGQLCRLEVMLWLLCFLSTK